VPVSTLVVSLHDVSPLTFARCRRIVAELEGLGVNRISLLVIPDHHGRGHVGSDAALCAWLRECAAKGHEIVTHGYFHQRPRREHESVVQRLITRTYTAGEGEFFDLSRERAAELAGRGRADLRELGLDSRGFIAPAWLLGAEAEKALRDLGYAYTTRLRTVHDLQNGTVQTSQSLCWSVRAAWRRQMSLAWNAGLYHRLLATPLVRVAVHPPDIDHPKIWRQIRSVVSASLQTRTPRTYLEALTAHAASFS